MYTAKRNEKSEDTTAMELHSHSLITNVVISPLHLFHFVDSRMLSSGLFRAHKIHSEPVSLSSSLHLRCNHISSLSSRKTAFPFIIHLNAITCHPMPAICLAHVCQMWFLLFVELSKCDSSYRPQSLFKQHTNMTISQWLCLYSAGIQTPCRFQCE